MGPCISENHFDALLWFWNKRVIPGEPGSLLNTTPYLVKQSLPFSYLQVHELWHHLWKAEWQSGLEDCPQLPLCQSHQQKEGKKRGRWVLGTPWRAARLPRAVSNEKALGMGLHRQGLFCTLRTSRKFVILAVVLIVAAITTTTTVKPYDQVRGSSVPRMVLSVLHTLSHVSSQWIFGVERIIVPIVLMKKLKLREMK